MVQPNSLQTELPYWVKIRHKTEQGNVVYFGYPSSTRHRSGLLHDEYAHPVVAYREDHRPRGRYWSGSVVLEEEVVHPPGPNQLGALHAFGDVSLTGAGRTIDGHNVAPNANACGAVGSLPPVVYGGTFTSDPAIQFNGNPASPQPSAHVPDPASALAALKTDAMVLNVTIKSISSWERAEVPMTFFAEGGLFPQPQGIRIRQTRGSGILLVDGNATLEGEVRWDGMILVTGTLFLNGQGSEIVIRGGVWAGAIDHQAGPLRVQYDSCLLRDALLAVPTPGNHVEGNFLTICFRGRNCDGHRGSGMGLS